MEEVYTSQLINDGNVASQLDQQFLRQSP